MAGRSWAGACFQQYRRPVLGPRAFVVSMLLLDLAILPPARDVPRRGPGALAGLQPDAPRRFGLRCHHGGLRLPSGGNPDSPWGSSWRWSPPSAHPPLPCCCFEVLHERHWRCSNHANIRPAAPPVDRVLRLFCSSPQTCTGSTHFPVDPRETNSNYGLQPAVVGPRLLGTYIAQPAKRATRGWRSASSSSAPRRDLWPRPDLLIPSLCAGLRAAHAPRSAEHDKGARRMTASEFTRRGQSARTGCRSCTN